MVQGIDPISAEQRLSQLLGEDELFAQAPVAPGAGITPTAAAPAAENVNFSGNMFDDILSKTIQSLENVSRSEVYANNLVSGYVKGEVELQEVMAAQAKMSIMVQMAVTTINSAVNTFKEVTQMQI